MLKFIKQYDSELIVFGGIGLAKLIIVTALICNGFAAEWVEGITAPWANL